MTVVFGGAFNPPHVGHRIVAEAAYDLLKPEKFLIIPTFIYFLFITFTCIPSITSNAFSCNSSF